MLGWRTELGKNSLLVFNSQTEELKASGKGQGAFLPSERAVLPSATYSPTPFSGSLQAVVLFLNKWRLLWTDIRYCLHVSFCNRESVVPSILPVPPGFRETFMTLASFSHTLDHLVAPRSATEVCESRSSSGNSQQRGQPASATAFAISVPWKWNEAYQELVTSIAEVRNQQGKGGHVRVQTIHLNSGYRAIPVYGLCPNKCLLTNHDS